MAGRQGETRGEFFTEAINLHNLGIDGDKEAVQKAHEILKEIFSKNPEDHLVEAYLGSVTALLGRDHENLNEKFKLALDGLKLLDSAVSKDRTNTEIRILRGYVCYNLPDMYFHRLATAVEDFDFLVSRYWRNKKIFSRDFYAKTLFDLGSAYKKMGRTKEAESTWKKLLSVTKEPKFLDLLRQEGFKIPEPVLRFKSRQASPVTYQSQKQSNEAKEMHQRALEGKKEDVLEAFAYFEKVHKEKPQDHLIKAYYADCLSMMGRDSEDHSLMFGNVIKAMIEFDKAVNGDPDNIEIRLLRANHSYRLPEVFFRRSATAMGDYEYLIQCYDQDNSIFDDETYLGILEKLGDVYERLEMNDIAHLVWDRLFSLTGEKKYQFKQRMDETGFDPDQAKNMKWKQALQEGIRLHDLGVAGNKKAAKIAEALLGGLYKERPRNQVAKGYYGSSMALNGWYSTSPGVMFSDGIKGFKLVKEAAESDPSNPSLRILRGYLAYNLPETFFHMTRLAIEDFRYLIKAYDKDNSIISKQLYRQLHKDLSTAYQRIGENARARQVLTVMARKFKDPQDKN